jgi:hypothetical protein
MQTAPKPNSRKIKNERCLLMGNKKIDLDSPRERFFGFWPRRKEAQVFTVLNILWILGACTMWNFLPDFYAFGWFPSFQLFAYVWAIIGAILWSSYTKKGWSANLQEDLDNERERKGGNVQ